MQLSTTLTKISLIVFTFFIRMASKKIKVDDFENKFSQMKIKRKTSNHYRELIKKYFLYENELCDWIINLWKYAKHMEHDETIEIYALVNLNLLKIIGIMKNIFLANFLLIIY